MQGAEHVPPDRRRSDRVQPQLLTVPATGAVIEASIFIASIVATVAGLDLVALGDDGSPRPGTARRRGRASRVGLLGGTWRRRRRRSGRAPLTGRSWPLIVHITVR
jgi:hypothetical protein